MSATVCFAEDSGKKSSSGLGICSRLKVQAAKSGVNFRTKSDTQVDWRVLTSQSPESDVVMYDCHNCRWCDSWVKVI